VKSVSFIKKWIINSILPQINKKNSILKSILLDYETNLLITLFYFSQQVLLKHQLDITTMPQEWLENSIIQYH
jgi:hypothetical protein